MDGQRVVPVEEMAAKIRSAVAARKDPDLVIVARTDAISAEGFREQGADPLFIEAPTTLEQLEQIPKLVRGPVLVNVAPKTPYLNASQYQDYGYAMAIYPPISLTTAYAALRAKLGELKTHGMTADGTHGGVPFDELVNFLGLARYRSLEQEVLAGCTGDGGAGGRQA
jgi:2-methylisocitrate lyase-like PEP mutase family enzyme